MTRPDRFRAALLLADNGIDIEAGEPLLIRRTVKADGGSRAFINAAGNFERTASGKTETVCVRK